MHFVRRADAAPHRLGILPGSFNPPTRAHHTLIQTAHKHVDELVCVVPRVFPHKLYHGATLEDRVEMLAALAPPDLPYSIAVAERGLFIDIARECRTAYGPEPDLIFVCGRDAAERIIEWDYGQPGMIDRVLQEFSLLVAARQGHYEPPSRLAARVERMEFDEALDDISSTEVRERIRSGQPWQHLVPEPILTKVQAVYLG